MAETVFAAVSTAITFTGLYIWCAITQNTHWQPSCRAAQRLTDPEPAWILAPPIVAEVLECEVFASPEALNISMSSAVSNNLSDACMNLLPSIQGHLQLNRYSSILDYVRRFW